MKWWRVRLAGAGAMCWRMRQSQFSRVRRRAHCLLRATSPLRIRRLPCRPVLSADPGSAGTALEMCREELVAVKPLCLFRKEEQRALWAYLGSLDVVRAFQAKQVSGGAGCPLMPLLTWA